MTVRDLVPLVSSHQPHSGKRSGAETRSTRLACSGGIACRLCPTFPGLAPPNCGAGSVGGLGLPGTLEEGVEEPKNPSLAVAYDRSREPTQFVHFPGAGA